MIGIFCSPFAVGDGARGDEKDIRLERALKSVFPALQGGKDGQVLGLQRVGAGREDVGELALVEKRGNLRFADDQLGAVFDLVFVAGEMPDERVGRIVRPLDDVDQFIAKFIEQPHVGSP